MTISSAAILTRGHQATSQTVSIDLLSREDSSRREAERFIKLVFRKAYGARISHFLPYLLSMSQNGQALAALGIHPAAEGELFLERYLDVPIENSLASVFKRPINRSRVVEVGNLASTHGGGARVLIVTLTAYLSGAGYEWVTFTATPQVRNNFAKLNINLTPLAEAEQTRLGDEQNSWGSYYQQAPKVVAGSVSHGAELIQAAMEREQLFPTARKLWDDAYQAGRGGRLWQPPHRLSGQWPEWALNEDAIS